MKAAADPDGIRRLADRVHAVLTETLGPLGDAPGATGFGHPVLADAAKRFHSGSGGTVTGLRETTDATGARLRQTADLYDEADQSSKDAVRRTADARRDDEPADHGQRASDSPKRTDDAKPGAGTGAPRAGGSGG